MINKLKYAFPDILVEYTQYMRVIKNRAPRTVEQYENDIVLFLCYVKATFDGSSTEPDDYTKVDISGVDADFMSKIRADHIYSFLSYAADKRGNKAGARARKLTAIKSFYKYLTVVTHRIKENPAKDIALAAEFLREQIGIL